MGGLSQMTKGITNPQAKITVLFKEDDDIANRPFWLLRESDKRRHACSTVTEDSEEEGEVVDCIDMDCSEIEAVNSRMLTCIACSKQLNTGPEEHDTAATPSTKQAIKALTAQIKDMAVKASGACKNCKPCSGGSNHNQKPNYAYSETGSVSERFHYSYKRTNSTPRVWGKEMKVLSSGGSTPVSVSGRSESVVGMEDDDESKEWVAQAEPGVLITFVSLPEGGNDLKRIRFGVKGMILVYDVNDLAYLSVTNWKAPLLSIAYASTFRRVSSRELFNKWQAQRWWAQNYDKVMELYNVRRFNRQAVPLPIPPRSEDENLKLEYAESSPVTPPLTKERLPSHFHCSTGAGHLTSGSLDRDPSQSHHYYDGGGPISTPKLSSISASKSERPSMDANARTSSSREADRSGELSVSNASDVETEWVEEDDPGVYITIRALPGGTRELRRVRFSREKFGEMHARLWWEENRARIQEQYL
ncbi:hypothetical protein RND71_006043 [Anisodus tanguticus]|uniref:BRX domain-containing protein n=1 Tax=Anisodus tanguticus TaxID=243964 RepID=A0AAE1SVD0_9SOLA|nr:hypothetical protein RND71_006043 [Anisodus tanguticus]